MELQKHIQKWGRLTRRTVFLLIVTLAPASRASTIWNGPPTNFTPSGTYVKTIPGTYDLLTADVALTRSVECPLFNSLKESGYNASYSPSNTLWAQGSLTDLSVLIADNAFETWGQAIGGCGDGSNLYGFLPGETYVVYLVPDDIYLSVTFNAWERGGAYSYTRTTPSTAAPTPDVSITSPTNGAAFTAPASVPITASASVVSGTVTNVAFFAGASLLGSVKTSPFSFTAENLAAGTYALTAVATAAGVSATSTVVNITVEPPMPTVSITNPVGGSVFAAPANVAIAVSASVSVGVVTNVTFYNGGADLGSATTPPFAITANSLAAANYALTAVATAAGISATSAVVNISVVSPVIVSNSSPSVAGGRFSFSFTANPGLTYVIESSSNLFHWWPIATNVATSNLVDFTDTSGLDSLLFYEVVLQPNP
jgi:hypothetical protein